MADLSDLVDQLGRFQEDVSAAAADTVLNDTQGAAPVKTGETRDSVHIDQTGSGQWTISADAPQAVFTDQGTRGPYIIRASSAKVLAFEWDSGPKGAGTYFFPQVTHPGIAAQHWFEDPMEERWASALQDAADGYSG